MIPALFRAIGEYNQAVENAVRNCQGYRITKQGDPSAAGRLQASLQDWCKMKQKAANKTASPPAQNQPPPAPVASNQPINSSQPVSGFQPENAVSCGSDITGTGGPPASTASCLSRAKWMDSEPYNHSNSPLSFHPFHGPIITINLGDSLWSVPDNSSPTGRRLEARPWDNQTSFRASQGKCAQENTSATVQPFIVRMECEIDRQAKLEKDFEAREDTCIPQSRCMQPPDFLSDWQQRPSSYWQANPQQHIGTCVVSIRDVREDRRCVREPDWHTASECKDYGRDPKLNIRGLLGCIYNEGIATGPAAQSSPRPNSVSEHWFVIAGSWPPEERTKATEQLELLSFNGVKAQIVETKDYPKLTPGLFAVLIGPFNREQADVQLLVVQAVVGDAYVKEAF